MTPEATLRQTASGLVPSTAGWFVMNAREGRWFGQAGQGDSLPLTGFDEYEAETFFPILGMSIQVCQPDEPNGRITGRPSRRTFSCSRARRS